MFTEKAQNLMDLAKDRAFARAKDELDLASILAAVGSDPEASVRLAECLTGGDTAVMRTKCPEMGFTAPCPGDLALSGAVKRVTASALEMASTKGVPDRVHPGLVDVKHLVCALAVSRKACRILGDVTPISLDEALEFLHLWYEELEERPTLGDLISRLRNLRTELLTRVFGQDHAVHTFVEALYNSEVTAVTDRERKRPSAVFVFAGPPGVGKTYMAELSASHLKRPFKRFDMTSYSDHQAHNQLIGFEPSYRDAQPGALTGFVEKNPKAVLLFDEIEKAHLNTIQLFYQVLDAGRLSDRYTRTEVSFRDTIIVFTTNAGRSLYDNPNSIGISAANSGYHKKNHTERPGK